MQCWRNGDQQEYRAAFERQNIYDFPFVLKCFIIEEKHAHGEGLLAFPFV